MDFGALRRKAVVSAGARAVDFRRDMGHPSFCNIIYPTVTLVNGKNKQVEATVCLGLRPTSGSSMAVAFRRNCLAQIYPEVCRSLKYHWADPRIAQGEKVRNGCFADVELDARGQLVR